jgi:hypothetical protein
VCVCGCVEDDGLLLLLLWRRCLLQVCRDQRTRWVHKTCRPHTPLVKALAASFCQADPFFLPCGGWREVWGVGAAAEGWVGGRCAQSQVCSYNRSLGLILRVADPQLQQDRRRRLPTVEDKRRQRAGDRLQYKERPPTRPTLTTACAFSSPLSQSRYSEYGIRISE